MPYTKLNTHAIAIGELEKPIKGRTSVTIYSNLNKNFKYSFEAFRGFKLLKWVSNSQDLLAQIEDHLKLTKTIEFDKTNLKILGLQWNPRLDVFTFKLNFQFTPCTKRNLLIFDPLGFLSPLTLFIKLLIKTLWQQNCDWDQPAPIEIIKFWNKVQNELIWLNELKIPRHLFIFENVTPAISPLYSLIIYFSSWTKLLHATIYVLRFLKFVSSQNRTTKDLKRAELILIRA
ncbi:hypothetical protein NQ317_015409, partial [Molorchus minor]